MSKDDLARPKSRSWTRPDDYFETLALRRTARRKRERGPMPAGTRAEPDSPRLFRSTLPFLALMAALGVLAVAIMIAAWPGRTQRHPPPQQRQQGVAAKGWFQTAQREFR